ncbi:MAG: NUDIX hydrolase [Dehalococcoidia bacterium]|nr:NUDIX hydrolase [Dehalococcoidia bacterium]
MSQERTLKTENIYHGKLVNLRVDTVELPLGKQTRREIVEHSACTAIVAIDSDNNVLLVRQYRKAVEKILLEIPAGCVEAGEEPLECARRELEEETGFSAEKWQKLSSFYTSPGFCTEDMHVYLATELRQAKREADDDENIEMLRMPLGKIPGIIESGEICDAKSIAGLLLALRTLCS